MSDVNAPTQPAAKPFNPFSPPIAPPTNDRPAEVRSVKGVTPTAPSNMADASPQDRWLADQAERARQDPWIDTTKVLTRDPKTSELVQRERVAGADGEIKPGKPVDERGVETETPAPDGEAKHKFGDLELTDTQIRDLVAHKAEQDLKKATLPPSADGYELKMPEGFRLPPGVDFKFASPDDPVRGAAIRAAQEWAHKNGFTQQQFSEAMSLYASANVAEQSAINAAAQRERDALGANGPIRVDTVSRWLTARYPGAAKTMINTLVTAKQLEAFEDIIGRFQNQSGSSFSRRGNEPEPQKLSEEAWSKMSYSDQKDYSARMTAAREAQAMKYCCPICLARGKKRRASIRGDIPIPLCRQCFDHSMQNPAPLHTILAPPPAEDVLARHAYVKAMTAAVVPVHVASRPIGVTLH